MALKPQQHPLMPLIRQWCDSSPEPVPPYLPEPQFMAALQASSLHPHEKRHSETTYRNAVILGRAIFSTAFDENLHKMLYRAAGHIGGFALGQAANFACRLGPRCFVAFAASTHLPGFHEALKAWRKIFWDDNFQWRDVMKWANRNLADDDPSARAFWIEACERISGDSATYRKDLSIERRNAKAAARMKKIQGKEGEPAKFKKMLMILWLPLALWCRSTKSIVNILAPDSTRPIEDCDRVKRDISALNFSDSRFPKNEVKIEKAEAPFIRE